jgi:hypothetical protein
MYKQSRTCCGYLVDSHILIHLERLILTPVDMLLHCICLQDCEQLEVGPSIAAQYALLLSQLQETQDDLAAAKRAMSRSKPKFSAAVRQVAAATAVVDQSAGVLQQLVDTVGLHWPEQQHAVFAAAAQDAQQRLQHGLLQRAEQQAAALVSLQQQLQQQGQFWQQAVLPAAQEAVAAVEAAAQQLQHGGSIFQQGNAQPLVIQLVAAERRLSQALEGLHVSSSSSSGASSLAGDELCVSAEVAGRDACATLLELSELLGRASAEVAAAAAGSDWQGVSAAEGWGDELAARTAVACRRLQEKEQVRLWCSCGGVLHSLV